MNITEFAILALATWRITSLIHSEDGPNNVFDWARHKLGVRFNELNQIYASNEVAKAVLCPWCLSIWIGVALALLWSVFPGLAIGFSLPFACSAVAILIHERIQ